MMIDSWDAMIAGDDEEVSAEIRADAAAYARHFMAGQTEACVAIAQKYGLFGLAPQQVSEQLAEMGKPEGGAA
jgi:hypothetical protein